MENKFDDIRPYYDSEISDAMNRIADSVSFPLLASYVYPDEKLEVVRKKIRSFTNIHDFQWEVMYQVNKRIIENSISEFTVNGLEYLSPSESYVYLSNHRDIMLDASLLQFFLANNGFESTEITFGANLMMNQLVIDIGKSNKMFKVERPGIGIREFYERSLHLSEYMRHVVTEKHQSLWIAQRNGRTKDGNDRTDEGIIKMFCMSMFKDRVRALAELHIVPMAVSYEWESCDILKTLELYSSQFSKYTKKPGEDLNSILTGILQYKGRVHFELCHPIELSELQQFSKLTAKEYYKAVADMTTKRIIDKYRLFPSNYIAYDLRYGCSEFSSKYTKEEKDMFLERVRKLEDFDSCELEQLVDIFLSIYSNPVKNKLSLLGCI